MIITPIKRITNRPVGVLLDGFVYGEWGITTPGESPKGAIVYARDHNDAFSMVRAGEGKAKYWRKRYVAYNVQGHAIKSGRELFSSRSHEEILDALRNVRDWAYENGGNFTSLTGTANSLWRATLPGNSRMMLASGKLPFPVDRLFLGGRQEATKGIYEAGDLWDIKAAYVSVMKTLLVGARYKRYSREDFDFERSLGMVGFARAKVEVKKTYWGPVPVTKSEKYGGMRFPINEDIEGFFDLQELRVAKLIGLSVTIYEVWIGRGLRLPWKKWADVIETGRELPGLASKIVKASSNSLWGTFAINGSGKWVSYPNGDSINVELIPEPFKMKNSEILASHVASTLRGRLFLEALYFNRDALLAAHTDGCIFKPNGHPVWEDGKYNGIGGWEKKDTLENLELLGSATYRHSRGYSIPGTPPKYHERVWKQLIRHHSLEG